MIKIFIIFAFVLGLVGSNYPMKEGRTDLCPLLFSTSFNQYKMKEINLTQGKVALVDDEDFEVLNKFKWCAHKKGNIFYACRAIPFNGKQTTIKMHQIIMGGKWLDHIDGNGCNNQKANLRFCTNSENCMNQRKCKNTTSIYKGVYFQKQAGKWRAQIYINGKLIYLGLFDDEVEAAEAYNLKAPEVHGEFANLNTF